MIIRRTPTVANPITDQDMDAMSDAEYDALADECNNRGHAKGACPLCTDDRQAAEDLGWDWDRYDDRYDYLGNMWGRSGFSFGRGKSLVGRSKGLIAAHAMVKSFVDTFATNEHRFQVTFDPSISTAGTDFSGKKIVITPAPVLDETLDSEAAGKILTGMAVHEASHVRYGAKIVTANHRAFKGAAIPTALGNILEDARIERHFARDFPGYANVFEPTMKYIAEAGLKRAGKVAVIPSLDRPVELAGCALRYDAWTDWSDPACAREREWWLDWANRHATLTTGREHVAAIREALDHINALEDEATEAAAKGATAGSADQSAGQAGDGEDPAEATADGGYGQPDADAKPQPKMTADEVPGDQAGEDPDEWAGAAPENRPHGIGEDGKRVVKAVFTADSELSLDCPNEAALGASLDNGVDANKVNGTEAMAIINDAMTMEDVEVEGWTGQLETVKVDFRPAKSLGARGGYAEVAASPVASAAVRNALMRSRTGTTGIDRGQNRGRCDSKSLSRIAMNDYRLFHRRHAPDPGKYLISMAIDWSGSMGGHPAAATIALAKSIADATRHAPSLRVKISGWTSKNHTAASRVPAAAGVYEAWRTGQPISDINDLGRIAMGGTPDAISLQAEINRVLREANRDEQPIVIMMSDGAGMGIPHMRRVVEEAAKRGVRVVSVSLGHQVSEDYQKAVYGEGNYIAWQGDITKTAYPLGRLFESLVKS